MCTMELALTVGTTLFGAYRANQQAKQQAKLEESAAAYNRAEALNKEIDIKNKAIFDENQHRRKVAQLLSSQRTQLAASGVTIDEGSATLLQDDVMKLGNLDAIQIRDNARMEADAVRRQGEYDYAVGMYNTAQTREKGKFELIGGLLTAGSQVFSSKWYTDKSAAKQKATKRYNIHSTASLNEQRYAF